MAITKVRLKNFTAFKELVFEPSEGLNVLVGANGTGKTHLMKVAYAACDVSKTGMNFAEKLIRVFLPKSRALGRLVRRQKGSSRAIVTVWRGNRRIKASFSNHTEKAERAHIIGFKDWTEEPVECVYIPPKEMLANAPGFLPLYSQREVHFEEIYADILNRAYKPVLRGRIERDRRKLLERIQKVISGKVTVKDDEFFLRNRQGNLEFTLLAEGMRKLGLLWLLIQNGTLLKGSILFWDEPETNLNPKVFRLVIEILLELQRMGVQIFLATHDYVILKEIDLQMKPEDKVVFHSFYRDENGDVRHLSTDRYLQIHPNAIADTFADLYNREIERTFGGSEG